MNKPIYDHRTQTKKRVLTVEQIDKLIELSVIAPKDKIDAVIKGLQLVLVGVACWAKKSLMEEELLVSKQDYQRRVSVDNQDEVDSHLGGSS